MSSSQRDTKHLPVEAKAVNHNLPTVREGSELFFAGRYQEAYDIFEKRFQSLKDPKDALYGLACLLTLGQDRATQEKAFNVRPKISLYEGITEEIHKIKICFYYLFYKLAVNLNNNQESANILNTLKSIYPIFKFIQIDKISIQHLVQIAIASLYTDETLEDSFKWVAEAAKHSDFGKFVQTQLHFAKAKKDKNYLQHPDYRKAFKLAKKFAAKNHPLFQHLLAVQLEAENKFDLAYGFYLKAANAGHAESCYMVAKYLGGAVLDPVTQQPVKPKQEKLSNEYQQAAIDHNYIVAIRNQAILSCQHKRKETYRWAYQLILKGAIPAEDAMCCGMLGLLVLRAHYPNFNINYEHFVLFEIEDIKKDLKQNFSIEQAKVLLKSAKFVKKEDLDITNVLTDFDKFLKEKEVKSVPAAVPTRSAALPATSAEEKQLEKSVSFDTALALFSRHHPAEAWQQLLKVVAENDLRAHLCLARMILVFHFGPQVVPSEWVVAEEAALSDSLKPLLAKYTPVQVRAHAEHVMKSPNITKKLEKMAIFTLGYLDLFEQDIIKVGGRFIVSFRGVHKKAAAGNKRALAKVYAYVLQAAKVPSHDFNKETFEALKAIADEGDTFAQLAVAELYETGISICTLDSVTGKIAEITYTLEANQALAKKYLDACKRTPIPAAAVPAVDEKKLEKESSFSIALALFSRQRLVEALQQLSKAAAENDPRAYLCLARMILVFHFGRQVVRSEWVDAEEAALSDSLKLLLARYSPAQACAYANFVIKSSSVNQQLEKMANSTLAYLDLFIQDNITIGSTNISFRETHKKAVAGDKRALVDMYTCILQASTVASADFNQETFAALKTIADAGDAFAKFVISKIYKAGIAINGVPVINCDNDLSRKYLRESADQKYPEAYYWLYAYLLLEPNNYPGGPLEALKYLEMGCQAEHEDASLELGMLVFAVLIIKKPVFSVNSQCLKLLFNDSEVEAKIKQHYSIENLIQILEKHKKELNIFPEIFTELKKNNLTDAKVAENKSSNSNEPKAALTMPAASVPSAAAPAAAAATVAPKKKRKKNKKKGVLTPSTKPKVNSSGSTTKPAIAGEKKQNPPAVAAEKTVPPKPQDTSAPSYEDLREQEKQRKLQQAKERDQKRAEKKDKAIQAEAEKAQAEKAKAEAKKAEAEKAEYQAERIAAEQKEKAERSARAQQAIEEAKAREENHKKILQKIDADFKASCHAQMISINKSRENSAKRIKELDKKIACVVDTHFSSKNILKKLKVRIKQTNKNIEEAGKRLEIIDTEIKKANENLGRRDAEIAAVSQRLKDRDAEIKAANERVKQTEEKINSLKQERIAREEKQLAPSAASALAEAKSNEAETLRHAFYLEWLHTQTVLTLKVVESINTQIEKLKTSALPKVVAENYIRQYKLVLTRMPPPSQPLPPSQPPMQQPIYAPPQQQFVPVPVPHVPPQFFAYTLPPQQQPMPMHQIPVHPQLPVQQQFFGYGPPPLPPPQAMHIPVPQPAYGNHQPVSQANANVQFFNPQTGQSHPFSPTVSNLPGFLAEQHARMNDLMQRGVLSAMLGKNK